MGNLVTLLPLIFFTFLATSLSVIDLKTHRLPNRLVMIATVGVLALGVTSHSKTKLTAAVLIGIAYLTIFAILKFVGKSSIGMGDVKFAFVCGVIVGIYDPANWLFNIWLMFAIAAIRILLKRLFSKVSWHERLAFGPYMALATILIAVNSLRSVFA